MSIAQNILDKYNSQIGRLLEYPEYHKGQLCIHKFMLCQEGFCSECAIHYQHKQNELSLDDKLNTDKLVMAEC